MSAIARYVQSRYAKPAYVIESFEVRGWPGLAMVVDALQRAGHEVDYCSEATAHRHRIVLVSITAACDWWSFIAERERWCPGKYTVIVGGPGVLNVRPFLRWFDVAVFGRGEELIVPLVAEILAGHRLQHPSLCYADEFDVGRIYRVAQASHPWPHAVRLEGGKLWTERAIGCQRRCLFCAYTWGRKNVGGKQSSASAMNAMAKTQKSEVTFFDLDLRRPETWPCIGNIGLDGYSEKLRFRVAKNITDEMVVMFLSGLTFRPGECAVKMYNICGYPGENESDLAAFVDVCKSAEGAAGTANRFILLQNTPFKPFPITPCATWPATFIDYRAKWRELWEGSKLRIMMSRTTEGLATQALDMVCFRAVEADADNVGRIARTRRFWGAKSAERLATLEHCFDLPTLFGEFTAETLPTRNLRTYAAVERQWGKRPWASKHNQLPGPGALEPWPPLDATYPSGVYLMQEETDMPGHQAPAHLPEIVRDKVHEETNIEQ